MTKKLNLTLEGAICLFALKHFWRDFGYVSFFGNKKDKYYHDLLALLNKHNKSHNGQIVEYSHSISHLMEKTIDLDDLREIHNHLPANFVMIMAYDTILRIQNGYAIDNAFGLKLREYVEKLKETIIEDFHISEELFEKMMEQFFPVVVAK